MTAQQAMESALIDAESNHLRDVLICGYDENGSLYIPLCSQKITGSCNRHEVFSNPFASDALLGYAIINPGI